MSLQHQCSPVGGAIVLWKAQGLVHFHLDAAVSQTFYGFFVSLVRDL